ncbi:YjdF family protein [Paenibacillus sp. KN14-4R]|uniref:YjdF family protein n=1 Tax=Paenibacillus sp. KN14-4R TaxID=3445773 RepID=UPI003FA0E9BF
MKLTVFYNGQYWVGVVEHQIGSKLKVCQFIFGAEPKDGEVMSFIQHQMPKLLSLARQQIEITPPCERRINPKRLARQIAKETQVRGVSTFAQEAMKLEIESRKKDQKVFTKQMREDLAERKRSLKVRQAKEKHRGR